MTWLAGVGGSSGTPGVGARSAAVAPLAASPVGCSSTWPLAVVLPSPAMLSLSLACSSALGGAPALP